MLDKARILDNIETVRAQGWCIVDGVWVDEDNKCCCALGASFVVEDRIHECNADVLASAADMFAVSQSDISRFVEGFDGDPDSTTIYDDKEPCEQWVLGRDIRSIVLT